jgi:succinylglutamic semialdehyde dehydrogenase
MHHASLRQPPANLIGGRFEPLASGPDEIVGGNPARPASVNWRGVPRVADVGRAVVAARAALRTWSRTTLDQRVAALRRFQKIAAGNVDRLAALIRDETGKPMWDSKAEAQLLSNKVDITLDSGEFGAMRRVAGYQVPLAESRVGRCWFRPHGVMAVLGPFNFPAHLPNGHIVPALAMGNTIVFKPSDKAPGSGQLLADMLQEALDAEGAPAGVVNLVHGRADVAQGLLRHEGIDGILFTGSWPVGRAILEANLDSPGRICALEMGGNNAAIVLPDADLKQAVIECVRSAYVSSGQRCTCTRRLIVHEAVASRVISAICKAASNLIIGDPGAEHPVFMGPVVSSGARDAILKAQESFIRHGAEALMPCTPSDGGTGGWYVTPGVLRVDAFTRGDSGAGADVEVFGPLLRISVVRSLDEAIAQANATRYGLAASIFTKDAAAIERFLGEAQAGCVNVNTGTAGASSKLPFGGLGLSGNHRPAGAFSLDYCAYPVAGMIESGQASTIATGMRFEESWVN